MYAPSHQSVATELFAIAISDTVNNAKRARSVYVGVGGNISFVDGKGQTTVLPNVPQGFMIDAECLRINATGTTASSLVGFV